MKLIGLILFLCGLMVIAIASYLITIDETLWFFICCAIGGFLVGLGMGMIKDE